MPLERDDRSRIYTSPDQLPPHMRRLHRKVLEAREQEQRERGRPIKRAVRKAKRAVKRDEYPSL